MDGEGVLSLQMLKKELERMYCMRNSDVKRRNWRLDDSASLVNGILGKIAREDL